MVSLDLQKKCLERHFSCCLLLFNYIISKQNLMNMFHVVDE